MFPGPNRHTCSRVEDEFTNHHSNDIGRCECSPEEKYGGNYGEDEKLSWIENKCNDKNFCKKNLGMCNERKVLEYYVTETEKARGTYSQPQIDDMLAQRDQQLAEAKEEAKANRRELDEFIRALKSNPQMGSY
ncbi:hypothetical protein Tco_0365000 [Tanacetum coccineum]